MPWLCEQPLACVVHAGQIWRSTAECLSPTTTLSPSEKWAWKRSRSRTLATPASGLPRCTSSTMTSRHSRKSAVHAPVLRPSNLRRRSRPQTYTLDHCRDHRSSAPKGPWHRPTCPSRAEDARGVRCTRVTARADKCPSPDGCFSAFQRTGRAMTCTPMLGSDVFARAVAKASLDRPRAGLGTARRRWGRVVRRGRARRGDRCLR